LNERLPVMLVSIMRTKCAIYHRYDTISIIYKITIHINRA